MLEWTGWGCLESPDDNNRRVSKIDRERMGGQIIGLQAWLATPPGQYLLDWERAQFEEAVSDVFGFHALQLGVPEIDGLHGNRMPHRWLSVDTPAPMPRPEGPAPTMPGRSAQRRVTLVSDYANLPFPANSLDLVILPHALEIGVDPHACLREVERVLVPEGRVVISGLNPVSLWGLSQRRAKAYRRIGFGSPFLPEQGEFIGYWRLRDWLRLLSFEVETSRFGCYRPSVRSQAWLDRFAWMDTIGPRWWPIFGAVYFVVAVKRVRGMRLMGTPWKAAPNRAGAPVSVVNQSQRQGSQAHSD